MSNPNLPHQESPPQTQPRHALCVTAPCSDSGKTLLIEKLLPCIGPVGVLKISPIPAPGGDRRIERQPATSIGADSFYLSPPDELTIPGKDTAKFLAAGAIHVERLRYEPAGLKAGLDFAMARFEAGLPVIIEGGSAAYHMPTAAVLLVARPPLADIKARTVDLLDRVDYLLVNASPAPGQIERTIKVLASLAGRFAPTTCWAADLMHQPLPNELVATIAAVLEQDLPGTASPWHGADR